MVVLHFLIHIFGIDYALPYGRWGWYNFWSGVSGSCLTGAGAFILSLWLHSTCHYSWKCLRRGKYQAAGGTFRLCWKHHPQMGVKPHRKMIHDMHDEWRNKVEGSQ
jgi:hypothetical protein